MVYQFKFSDVGEGIHEAELVNWLVKEGDSVKEDQPLCEVETDKAIVEIPCPKDGKIVKLYFKKGDVVKVGDVLIDIETGEDEATEEKKGGQKAEEEKEILKEETKEESEVRTEQVLATPHTRKLARELDVDISKVKGTGPSGRVMEKDVQRVAGKTEEKKAVKEVVEEKKEIASKIEEKGEVERIPLKGMRKVIAERMIESKQKTAQVTHMDEADVTELFGVKEKYKKKGKKVKLTLFPFIIKAMATVLKEHPSLNASIEGEEIIYKKYYHCGIAVDTPKGLVAPVIRNVDEKTVLEIAKEIKSFAIRARERDLRPEDVKEGTFTITNIGSIGGIQATPIINYPECAILGVMRLQERVRIIDGEMNIRKILPLNLTYDHRITDGAEAARFMNDLIKHLSDTTLMLVDVV